jgi:peptidoglycan/xylan/chitin deacetylase (PgdA/CDA1 family)
LSDVLVLCYHAVSDTWEAPLSVTPRCLEEHLELVVKRGYRGSTFTEAVLGPPFPKTVAVTFDDAFSSVLEKAHPILDRLGLVATIFVPTDFPDGTDARLSWPGIDNWLGGEHDAELRPMSWEEVRGLADEGWEIGSHTKSHPRLPSLADHELDTELTESREVVEERLGCPCPALAYPYGDQDGRVVEAAARAGYTAAGALPSRLRKGGPLCWPRVGVNQRDDLRRFRLKVSRAMRRFRASPLWPERR